MERLHPGLQLAPLAHFKSKVRVCLRRQAVRRIRSTDSTTVDGQTLRCSLTVQIERKAAAEVLGWKAGVANS